MKKCIFTDCKHEGTEGCRVKGWDVFLVKCDKYSPDHSGIIKKLKSHRNSLKTIKANAFDRDVLSVIIRALEA